ncbi:alpha amylase C-terminal domain-containing protein [Methylobacterium sp. CB376]|uniref:alpha amylase C-terminal domain-containing protein n=1 Tax=Methylobacterium sp. CB376 TaxID=3138063 RepID=UPI0024B05DDF|nr:alpha amylase C-terminal domain-containing protein [Methylobacterium nodulans]WFT81414.1 alpha amylase C-terminal domain-containing protein [Methylobacterium nodulans]
MRQALAQAAGGRDADVNLDPVAQALAAWNGLPQRWRAVQMLENHDVLLVAHEAKDRRPRVPAAADPSNARSWYARSRSRVATGLLLTGPGIPLLFMGQEFLEDKLWSDSPDDPDHRIWWDGLRQDRAMADFLRFTRELIGLRRAQPALTRGEINVFHVHNLNRVIAYHRWLPGQGRDVVVAASLAEATRHGYALGFPRGGTWREAFNSDVYDGWVNPAVAGNSGAIEAGGPPLHGLPHSAAVVLPANAVVVFVKEDP